MNKSTVGQVRTAADIVTPDTTAAADAKVTEPLYRNILSSRVKQIGKPEGWLGRISNRSFKACLAPIGAKNTMQ